MASASPNDMWEAQGGFSRISIRAGSLDQSKSHVLPDELDVGVVAGVPRRKTGFSHVRGSLVEMADGLEAGGVVPVRKVDDVRAVVALAGEPGLELIDLITFGHDAAFILKENLGD